jgi:predicted transcriptional regulator
MNEPIILSIRQRWVDDIIAGRKKTEIRRGLLPVPVCNGNADVFIYATVPTGRVVGKCTLSYRGYVKDFTPQIGHDACMTKEEWDGYRCGTRELHIYGIHGLQVFGEGYHISDFGIKRPPQFFAYAKHIPEDV